MGFRRSERDLGVWDERHLSEDGNGQELFVSMRGERAIVSSAYIDADLYDTVATEKYDPNQTKPKIKQENYKQVSTPLPYI